MAALRSAMNQPNHSSPPSTDPTAVPPRWASPAVAALALWCLWPVLRAQHLEGYTANVQAAAIMAGRGALARTDPFLPILTDFIYHTRAGMVALLRSVYAVVGGAGDGAFRGVMIAALALMLVAATQVARRAGAAPGWATLAALLLVPGITEIAFAFEDNLPSAALLVAAAALAGWRPTASAAVAAGVMIGAGTLIRVDGILLAPLTVGMLWLAQPRRWLVPAAVAAGAALATLAVGALVLGSTPLDAMIVSSKGFVPHWEAKAAVQAVVGFFSLPGGVLVAAGFWLNWRDRRAHGIAWLAVWMAYPLLLLAAAVKLSTEVRYVLPLLSPFVALHGGRALAALAAGVASRVRAARGAAVALAIALLLPPLAYVRDGPHGVWGRLWMPLFWTKWQNGMQASLAVIDGVVARAERDGPGTLVINTHFSDEFYLKERLIAAGFTPEDATRAYPGCWGFSLYRKGTHRLAQIRTDNEYGLAPTWRTRYGALVLAQALACPALAGYRPAILTAYGTTARLTLSGAMEPVLWRPVLYRLPPPTTLVMDFSPRSFLRWNGPATSEYPGRFMEGRMVAVDLSTRDLAALAQRARDFARIPIQPRRGSGVPEDGPVDRAIATRSFAQVCRPVQESPRTLWPRCLP